MEGFDLIAGVIEFGSNLLDHHDAAMLSASAADGDGEVAFSFLDIVREQVEEKVGNTAQELASLGKGTHIVGDGGVEPGKLAELGHVVGIGQKPDVEDHIGIEGNTIFEAEAETTDQQMLGLILLTEASEDVGAEFVDVEGRGVDKSVGDIADRIEELAFFDDGTGDGFLLAEGVGATGFGVTTNEDGVLGVEENDASRKLLTDLLEDFGESVEGLTFAHINDDGGAVDFGGVTNEAGKIGQQFEGQVVNGVKAEILKSLEG